MTITLTHMDSYEITVKEWAVDGNWRLGREVTGPEWLKSVGFKLCVPDPMLASWLNLKWDNDPMRKMVADGYAQLHIVGAPFDDPFVAELNGERVMVERVPGLENTHGESFGADECAKLTEG